MSLIFIHQNIFINKFIKNCINDTQNPKTYHTCFICALSKILRNIQPGSVVLFVNGHLYFFETQIITHSKLNSLPYQWYQDNTQQVLFLCLLCRFPLVSWISDTSSKFNFFSATRIYNGPQFKYSSLHSFM